MLYLVVLQADEVEHLVVLIDPQEGFVVLEQLAVDPLLPVELAEPHF